MSVSTEPGPLHARWWAVSDVGRLLARAFVYRVLPASNFSLPAVFLARMMALWAVGNPWWSAPFVLAVVLGLPGWFVLAVGGAVEVWLGVYQWRHDGRRHLVDLWRQAWRFRRQWPRLWAECAARTRAVQSPDGGAHGESRAPIIRPICDSPRLAARFYLNDQTLVFRTGTAPGRSFVEYEEIASKLSANSEWVHAVGVRYRTDRASFGLLEVAICDVLARPARPAWLTQKVEL